MPNKNMNNQEAKNLVENLIGKISNAKTIHSLHHIPFELNLKDEITKNMPGAMYPKLGMKISPEDIKQLQASGCVNEEMQFSHTIATGQGSNGSQLTALEKLLFSVIWKNGDLGKEKHLIKGVLNTGHNENTGTVFYEFGGYLSGRNPFILDQHTLRCFGVYFENEDISLTLARKMSVVKAQQYDHQKWIAAYKHFYDELLKETAHDSNFLYEVDRLLFGVGKLIKI